jgi:glycosyltransferase involved in cell wall biosynthesis
MAKISVVLTTFNEGKNIGECLETVKDWADEIIVVDGESKDETVEVAQKYTDKIFIVPNQPIFHINKQIAIDKARGDWILQLDADERVTPQLRDEVLSINNHQSTIINQPVAYWIPRKNYFLGQWLRKGGQYPDAVIRFFKKGKARLPCKSVHEQMEVEGEVGWLKGHLLHHTAETFSGYLARENRYSTLRAQEMIEEGLKVSWSTFIRYMFWLPLKTWFLLFFRHKGFRDGFPGFVFSLFSGFHHRWSFIKFWELKKTGRKIDIERDWV